MAKLAKRQMTYKEAHNKAVRMYQRCSIFLLWVGIVNVFACLIGVIQIATGTTMQALSYDWPSSGFALTLTIQILINNLLLKAISSLWASFIIMAIALVFGALFAFGGYFASKGNIILLFIGGGLYALDFGAMFFIYKYFAPFAWTNYAFTLVIHVLVLAALIFAIVQYYNVFHIEKVFKGDNKAKLDEEVESEVIASGK